jgi:DNA-binding NtrC family response regulator
MSKIKLLLVDDEEGFVRTMAERLEMRGMASRVATSGEEALLMVDRDAPEVMVLDLRMPGIDGMSVLERVRERHPHVQVIVLTGQGSGDDEKRARDLGAFRYLEKPADTVELVQTIRAAWKRALAVLKDSRDGFDRHMMAAAMAEAGEPEMALEELDREKDEEDDEDADVVLVQEAVNVLFVDDEEDFVRTMAERMRLRNVGADVALSGEAALESLAHDLPDVVVLDLKMPGLDGMEVLRRMRDRYPSVEVIILTGHGSSRDEAEALRIGAFAYLQKPVELSELVENLWKAGRAARASRGEERGEVAPGTVGE